MLLMIKVRHHLYKRVDKK